MSDSPSPASPIAAYPDPDFANADTAGLYPLGDDQGFLAENASRHGVVTTLIDCSGCAHKADLLERIASGLQFPDWFGHNWDALADCLDDLGWLPPAQGRMIVLTGLQHLHDTSPEDLRIAKEVFADAARQSASTPSPIWVFIEDPEPARGDLTPPDHDGVQA